MDFAFRGIAGGVEEWFLMRANRRVEGTGDLAVSEVPVVASKFKSVRRVFRIMDLVSQRGENLTAKELAWELDTNLSSCYYLLNILTDEGYIRKVAGGYRIGPTIPLLNEGLRSDFDVRIEPVVEELARRAQRHAYAAVLSDGEAVVTQAKAPEKRSCVGVVEGFHGASHALALQRLDGAGHGEIGLTRSRRSDAEGQILGVNVCEVIALVAPARADGAARHAHRAAVQRLVDAERAGHIA